MGQKLAAETIRGEKNYIKVQYSRYIYLLSATAAFLSALSIVYIVICAMRRHNSVLKCMKVFGGSKLIQGARGESYIDFNSPRRQIILPGFMPHTRSASPVERGTHRRILKYDGSSRVSKLLSPSPSLSCFHCFTLLRRALSSR